MVWENHDQTVPGPKNIISSGTWIPQKDPFFDAESHNTNFFWPLKKSFLGKKV